MPPRRSAPKNIHTAHQTKPEHSQVALRNTNTLCLQRRVYIMGCASTHSAQEVQSRRTGPASLLLSLRWRGGFRPCLAQRPPTCLQAVPHRPFYPAAFLPPGSRSESLAAAEDFPQSRRRMWRRRRQGSLSLFVRILFGSCWRDWKSSPSLLPPLKLSKSNLTDSFYTCNIIHPPKMNTFLKVRSALQAGKTLMGRA